MCSSQLLQQLILNSESTMAGGNIKPLSAKVQRNVTEGLYRIVLTSFVYH